jgi:hypothetical protein
MRAKKKRDKKRAQAGATAQSPPSSTRNETAQGNDDREQKDSSTSNVPRIPKKTVGRGKSLH